MFNTLSRKSIEFPNYENSVQSEWYLSSSFEDTREEKFMFDCYTMIHNCKLLELNYLKDDKVISAIQFPKDFVNVILNFKTRNDYLNSLRLNFIIVTMQGKAIINYKYNVDYNQVKSSRDFPITHNLNSLYLKYRDRINKCVVENYIYTFIDEKFCDNLLCDYNRRCT